jgi:hypothetical protein
MRLVITNAKVPIRQLSIQAKSASHSIRTMVSATATGCAMTSRGKLIGSLSRKAAMNVSRYSARGITHSNGAEARSVVT